MPKYRTIAGLLAAAMALAFGAGAILAKPAEKEKKKDEPAKQVQAQAAKAAQVQACPQTRPANCPVCCPNCPQNRQGAAATGQAPNNAAPAAAKGMDVAPAGPGAGRGPGWRQGGGGGPRGGGGPPWMRSNSAPQAGQPQPENRSPMEVFHSLLNQHTKIRRTVEEVPGGVFTTTTSDDPAVARDIQIHVRQMKERIENGQPLRRWDPLFDELFRNAAKITMKIEETRNGAKVTETSDDPQVCKLIRQHAIRGVSEFVKDGFDRAHKASPLPEGYTAPAQAKPVEPKDKDAKPVDSRPRWGRQGRTVQ